MAGDRHSTTGPPLSASAPHLSYTFRVASRGQKSSASRKARPQRVQKAAGSPVCALKKGRLRPTAVAPTPAPPPLPPALLAAEMRPWRCRVATADSSACAKRAAGGGLPRAGGGGPQLNLREAGRGAVEGQPGVGDGMRLDRDHLAGAADVARQNHGVGADVGADIDEHPGYNLIRKGMYEGKRIHYWLARGSIRTNRKGLLFRYVSKRSTSQMTKHQLQNLIAAMKRERQESRKVLQIYREAFDEIRASIKRSNDRQAAAQ